MLQQVLETVSAHPLATLSTTLGATAASELLGLTKKGGIIKTLADLIIALGRVITEMRKEKSASNQDGGPQA